MPGELWSPDGGDAPGLAILVPGARISFRCDYCGAEFYDTGDGPADERRFLRHEHECWRKLGADEVGEAVEVRRTEPAFESDNEYDEWAREKAERERSPFVKGTSAWDPRTAVGKRRKEKG